MENSIKKASKFILIKWIVSAPVFTYAASASTLLIINRLLEIPALV